MLYKLQCCLVDRQACFAGRVQSVALRLMTERETEIGAFKPKKTFSVDVILTAGNGISFPARLSMVSTLERSEMERQGRAGNANRDKEMHMIRFAAVRLSAGM